VSPNESTAPRRPRRRRRSALNSGIAVIAGSLVIGGLTTYAAATASANSQIVSLGGSVPAASSAESSAAPTTTTTAPPATHVVDAPITAAGPANAVQQTIGISVLPGPMTVTPSSESVPLTQVRPFGRAEPDYKGAASTITVDDARGSLVGWRATVSLQTVSGLDATQLAGARLCVSPHPTTLVAGNPADVVRNSPRACSSPGDPVAVFSAAPGGGGGVYSDTADVLLVLKDAPAATSLTASLAISVS
jgi:hypothetical protein